MNSEQEFKCIFCSETFQEKEALQVHFRKHGDPNFKSNQGDEGNSAQRSKDQMEIVECDVCPEVFTSISKAITHKHKLHPDHDAKYFCPWCGKLFTMKHLYNKHIHTNHPEIEKKHDKYFPCDSCNVAFTVPAAMMYHNKFFHRQDTDLPSIGTSKKLKIFNQEVVQIYYCPFCGEEYENKVNLHKHIGDDHSDENQSPEDILRCPLCDAVFYHLDAYELHLTYHSIEDMYSERNEMADQITDFSLESVPPMAEKVENLEETPGGDDDNDKIGIEQLLEFAMEEPKDKKSKKHKKHKKSKKPAITLDEFFNMNKDVFGEEIDFQGVEEVPTQVVKKRLKAKKSVPAKLLSPDLEKLKQQGIVVKKKPGRRIPLKKGPVKMAQHLNTPSNKPPMKSEVITNKLSTSEEVISKLLNQGNSQIKIVKKSNTNNSKAENNEDDLKQEGCKTTIPLSSKNIDSIENQSEIEDSNPKTLIEHQDNETISRIQEQNKKENQAEIIQTENTQKLLEDNNQDHVDDTDTSTKLETDECAVDPLKLLKNNVNIVIKSNKPLNQAPSNVLKKVNEINEQANKKVKNNAENKSDEDIENDDDADTIGDQNNTKNNSLNVLKHLSHLTVKSNKTSTSEITKESPEIRKYSTEQNGRQTKQAAIIKNESTNHATIKNEPIPLPTKHTDIIKNKAIPLPFKEEIDYQETHEDDEIETKPMVDKIKTNKVPAAFKNPQLTVQTRKSSPVASPQKALLKDNIATDTNPSSLDLIKHLKNVTAKPINKNPTVQTSQVSPKPISIKQEMKSQISPVPKKVEENIEIVDIDDSDSDEGQYKNNDFKPPKTVNSPSNIKTLHKNLTGQTLKPSSNDVRNTVHQIKKEPVDENNDDYFKDNLNFTKTTNIKNEPAPIIDKRINDSSQDRNLPFNNMLKNLSKNITIKSRNSSPQNVKNHNIKLLQDFDSDEAENDVDFHSSKVQISEVENTSDDDLPQSSNTNELPANNVKVQYPDDSESDHDGEAYDKEFDQQFSDEDIESQIKATKMIKKSPGINKPPVNHNLNSLQKLGKNITIKSNKQVKPINENPESTSSQDDIPPFAKNLNQQVLKKNISQANKNNEVSKIVNNTTSMEKGALSSSNQLINQNTMSNQVETKEVKRVKTFKTDTQTVIEEITTTVTKTIKTVNQTTKQETHQQTTSNNPSIPRMQAPSQIPSQRNYQGVKVRQAVPIITPNKIRSNLHVRVPCNVRPGNQIVPARPRLNAPRMIKPRMAGPRCMKIAAAAAQRMQAGTPVKTLAVIQNTAKRQNTDEPPAHFSCFKKPKESLIPVSDVPIMKNLQDPSIQYSSVQMNKSNYSCTTSAVKGNSVVTSTQMRSESSASSQHLSKLQSMSGLSVVKASQVKQAVVEEKSEISASQKNTLDAIQRLQSQGLLIKKPRVDLYTENEYSDPGSDADDAGHYHDDE